MYKALAVLALTLFSFSYAKAQTKIQLIPSGQWLEEGDKLNDSSQYKQAIEAFRHVDRSDTNYVRALYGIAVSYLADSQYDAAVEYCRMALAAHTDPEKEPAIWNEYANALDAANMYPEAIRAYDSGIARYPAFALLYMNKGNSLLKQERYGEAEVLFKQSLLINPYLYSAHYKLALRALNEGKIVQAFLGFVAYLMMSPEGRYRSNAVSLLSSIAKYENDVRTIVEKRKEEPTENFAALEQILTSKIALDKSYKPLIPLDDAITRQIQALFEKMEYDENDTDFWMQYYIPYFKQVYTSGQFENFIYHTFSGVDIAPIQDYIKKNKKAISAYVASVAPYFDLIQSTRELMLKKRATTELVYFINNEGQLTGRGKLDAKNNATGPCEFYYAPGNLKCTGTYTADSKRDGVWNYYYFDGALKATENYKNGSLEGEQVNYFNNGVVSSRVNYKNNLQEGEATSFYLTGLPNYVTNYHLDKEDGIRITFSKTGDTSSLETYVAEKLDGVSKSWYRNGMLESVTNYRKDEAEGEYRQYYEDGKLKEEGQYAAGKQTGLWKDYYHNGQLKNSRNFVNGKEDGEYKMFYDNGVLATTYTSRNGKTIGSYNEYDYDGKRYATYAFSNDLIQKVTFFDKTGTTLSVSERKDKQLNLTELRPDGSRKAQMAYNEKGDINGTQTFYFLSGKEVTETDEYGDGTENGPSINYYPGGGKKSETGYTGKELDGYHASWYPNGIMEEQGWYRDNAPQGSWISYDDLGKVTDSTYFLNGSLSGYKSSFYPNGVKSEMKRYRSGWLQEIIQFDSTGKELQHNYFRNGNGKMVYVFPNGKPDLELDYKKGLPDGARKTFYFDGKPGDISYYAHGVLNGSYKSWTHTGALNTEGQYRDGDPAGVWKSYENGKLRRKMEYRSGKLDGKDTYYYENGNIETEISMKDGQRDGLYRYMDPGGTLIYQVNYRQDVPISYSWLDNQDSLVPAVAIERGAAKIKTYFPNGNVSAELEYYDGYLHGEYKLYYTNGQLHIVKHRKYGLLDGDFVEYYPNGKTKSITPYLNDKEHGISKEFYENGPIREEASLYLDSRHGPTKNYDASGKLKSVDMYYNGKLLAVKNGSAQ